MTIIEEQLAENNLTVNSHFEKDLEIKITEKIIKFDGIFSSGIEIDVPLKFY